MRKYKKYAKGVKSLSNDRIGIKDTDVGMVFEAHAWHEYVSITFSINSPHKAFFSVNLLSKEAEKLISQLQLSLEDFKQELKTK